MFDVKNSIPIPLDGAVVGLDAPISGGKELMLPANSLPQEIKAKETSILAETVMVGDMPQYDMAVEPEVKLPKSRSPIWNRKVRAITDSCGHKIYAWVTEDEKGNRHFEVCQEYQSGDFSPVLKMPLADVIMASASQYSVQKETAKSVAKYGKMYLNKFRGMACDIIKINDIFNALSAELPKIPVYNDDLSEDEKLELQRKIYEIAGTLTSQMMKEHDAYFALEKDDMEYIARHLGMEFISLLRKLKKFNLLYLTPSSRGFQTCVRMNGTGNDSYTAWRYCVFRDAELAKTDEYLDYSQEF